MRNLVFAGLVTGSLVVLTLTGCAKKETAETEAAAETPAEATADATATAAPAPAPTAPAGAETLPGASAVRDALAKQDYETAVGALLALRGAATGPERQMEYTTLYGEVVDTLRAEAPSNRKAAEAYASLVAATRGR